MDGMWPFLAGLAPGARSRFWELVGWGLVGLCGSVARFASLGSFHFAAESLCFCRLSGVHHLPLLFRFCSGQSGESACGDAMSVCRLRRRRNGGSVSLK